MYRRNVVISADLGVTHLETKQKVDATTLYDLASLTKVIATLPAILLLLTEAKIGLDSTLADFFPDSPARLKPITITQLLSHSSGLAAGLPGFERTSRIELPHSIYEQPLSGPLGQQVVYSDLGMILLGLIVEKVSGNRLDRFVVERVFQPLHMQDTCFLPNPTKHARIAATEYSSSERRYIMGQVHDEKAWAMGGVAGHAGLFSTADDLCRYANWWLYGDDKTLTISKEWRRLSCQNWTRNLSDSRGLGWELNQALAGKSCGTRFGRASFGHTGFTGTSMWIDPHAEVAVVLLTNAVHIGRERSQIRSIRPALHDVIMTELFGSQS